MSIITTVHVQITFGKFSILMFVAFVVLCLLASANEN